MSCFKVEDSVQSNSNTDSAEVIINFPYFIPYTVIINSTVDNWSDHDIWQTGTSSFKYTYRNVSGSNLISVKFGVSNPPPDAFNMYPVWINGPNGIQYADVKINGTTLSREYSVDNGLGGTNISFTLNSDGSPSPTGTPISFNANIPPEVAHPRRYVGTALPPPDKQYIQGWFQALHDNRFPQEISTIEVKSIKLYAYINNSPTPTLLLNYTYSPGSTFYDGGLFYRYPFFPPGDYHTAMTPYSTISQSGILSFNPSSLKTKVWHWWHEPRVLNPAGATAYRLEAEIMITGKACVEAGLDFKNQTSPQGVECGAGDWYFEQPFWQTVVFDSR